MFNLKMERKMKNQSENVWAAAQLSYEAPCVDVLNVEVERGFAQSLEGSDDAIGHLDQEDF
jgi:hypothetical protein